MVVILYHVLLDRQGSTMFFRYAMGIQALPTHSVDEPRF